jgi:hypothetical protein
VESSKGLKELAASSDSKKIEDRVGQNKLTTVRPKIWRMWNGLAGRNRTLDEFNASSAVGAT